MLKIPTKLAKDLEACLDTNIRFESDGKTILISVCSPCDQDCCMEIELKESNTLATLTDRVYGYYEDFDPSQEAYLWLDETGHGTNGAPYDMGDVYADMKWRQNWMLEVSNTIRKYI